MAKIVIGADCETDDELLKTQGYSWKYNQGYVLCTALYCILIPYKFTKGISPVDGQSNWSMFYPWQSFILPVENAERNERMQRINQFR